MSSIQIGDFSKDVKKLLHEYGADVNKVVRVQVKKAAESAKKNLQKSSPHRTGSYAKGWRTASSGDDARPSARVYNAKRWQLTHLLEKGHAKKNGGRVPAIPHIEAAADRGARDLEAGILRELNQ